MNARKLVASMMVSALAIGTSTGALAADVNQNETKAMEQISSIVAVKNGQVPEGHEQIGLPEGMKFFEDLKDGEWIPAFQMTEANMAIAIPDNLDSMNDQELAKLMAELEMNAEEFATFKADALKNKAEFQQSGEGTEATATTVSMAAVNTAE